MFSVKDQTVNVSGCRVSVAATQLHHYSVKTATDNTQVREQDSVLVIDTRIRISCNFHMSPNNIFILSNHLKM